MRVACPRVSSARTVRPSRVAVVVQAQKGFGASKSPSKGKQDKSAKARKRAKKSKGKTGYRPMAKVRQPEAKQPVDGQQQVSRPLTDMQAPEGVYVAPAEDTPPEPEVVKESPAEVAAFEERLSSLKADSSLLAKEKAIKSKAAESPLGATIAEDLYKNPPSIMDTMTGGAENKEDKVDVFGGNRAATLGASIFLAVILLIGTIGFDGGGGGGQQSQTSQDTLTTEERKQLETQRDEFASRLAADSNDVEVIEALAVTTANLGDYSGAEQLLSQLVELKGDDPDAWRLLGETRVALGRTADAVAAYRAGRDRSPEDIGLLKGVAGALVQDGKPEAAVKELQAVGERVRARAGAATEGPRRSIGSVEVDLLLAKVYSQWKGHTGDALAVYERVIAENPEDFRGYLAKGVLLRSEGRKGDADRAFLQARFLAPKELRNVVDRVAVPEN
eukprot:jgi/Ulvmu1/1327/UM011_0055.1